MGSYVDRAEMMVSLLSMGMTRGMNFWQLSCTQPVSALVTTVTGPYCSASDSTAMMLCDSSVSCDSSSLTRAGSLSRRRPREDRNEEHSSVSSQSNAISVSCSALRLVGSVCSTTCVQLEIGMENMAWRGGMKCSGEGSED